MRDNKSALINQDPFRKKRDSLIMMPKESALVVLIPEAEQLVEGFRKRFDPSAAWGVPAHVTILYPFKQPDELTSTVFGILKDILKKEPAFIVSFRELKRFPNTLYLAPEPAAPILRLIELICKRFPDTPPYCGEFAETIPHLTVAQADDAGQLDAIAAEFKQAAKKQLPVRARVDSVALIENSLERWQVRERFPLRTTSKKN
jgi:2'-5' RNA ligase